MMKKKDINFDWKYSPDFREEYIQVDFDDSSFKTVQIPHTNIEVPYNNFDEKIYQFESCYRKNIWIDPLGEKEGVFIKFEAVMTYAKVFLNGHYLGQHKGGYTPFRLDLTEFAIGGQYNCLVVYVDSREREDIPPFGFVIDYLTYGGIYRQVSLEYVHEIHVEHIGIKTQDLLSKSPKINIDLYIHNKKKSRENLTFSFSILRKGQCVEAFQKKVQLNARNKEVLTISHGLGKIELWSLENPTLYTLECSLLQGEKTLDKHLINFGFREIEFKRDGFYLNGEKIKLRGLNRHQSFPYVGYAMPKSAQYKDAEILKYELGLNIVRLSHYPQSDHFLDRCDQIGLLVFDEIPGWQHIGDKKWQDISINNVKEMILKDVNHPSVIIWGVRINESQDMDDFYTKTQAMAKEVDDSRPSGGVRNKKFSSLLEDVYTYNDFSHTGKNRGLEKKKKVTKTRKPYLVTEYNGHMFPTKKFDNESRRVEQALRHLNVLEAMEGDEDILGAIGWSMFDYNTHKDFGSGDRICYHGVMDMYRIPKYAAFAYQSQQDTIPVMHVASSLNIGEYDSSLLEDIHVFTNCDYIKLFKNDVYINTFYPNKKRYPNLPHPPIIIDDLIGEAIKEKEKFTPKDAERVKQLLIKVNKSGLDLALIDSLKMAKIFFKYKLTMADAEALYTKYFGGWGEKATDYHFEGYIKDRCLIKVYKGQASKFNLIMKVDKDELIEDVTYDVSRITLELIDEYGNTMIYANDVVKLEKEGPLEIIGPLEISLIGGSLGFWIKTAGKSGLGKIKVVSSRFGILEKSIKIEKIS
ncbi:MAG: glycoside hydrolase family 2 protein [Tissierellia bacterium]|nr:glycoside hydrolase family 2 protein [Tissierellia bacterium]